MDVHWDIKIIGMKTIKFSGSIDERTEWPEIDRSQGRVDIDLGDIELMNSAGCGAWVKWVRGVQVKDGIFLHNCPPHFITQASILIGIVPAGVTVQSFFVPYFCDSCGASEQLRFELGKDFH